jgi:hypothetical protein
MCLIVNRFRHWQLKPKVAKKNILCYKILEIDIADETYNYKKLIRTPYQGDLIKSFDKCITPDYFQEEFKMGEQLIIEHGIHSFRNITAAKNRNLELSIGRLPNDIQYVIAFCYIPKGTKYWIGRDCDYCSECLMFV